MPLDEERGGVFSLAPQFDVTRRQQTYLPGTDVLLTRFLFEKTLGYANHVGLYAEETGLGGQQLGNFPQAFTHLALISAAHYLDRVLRSAAPSRTVAARRRRDASRDGA